jgi:hypothetical protein
VPKSKDSEFEAMGFVVSVVDHSPRLLLTVGDLVQTNSCQNYKTGGLIRTLPGYVIDANVQVMASFHVEAKHFKSHQEYRAVLDGLEAGDMKGVRFRGNKRILEFTLADGSKIETEYLGFAFLRQMLKLGYVDTDKRHPSLRLEREFMQNSQLMPLMQQNHQKLLKDLVQEMQAVQNERMTIPKTRNPEGVYSDLGLRPMGENGVKCGPYQFDPQPNQ